MMMFRALAVAQLGLLAAGLPWRDGDTVRDACRARFDTYATEADIPEEAKRLVILPGETVSRATGYGGCPYITAVEIYSDELPWGAFMGGLGTHAGSTVGGFTVHIGPDVTKLPENLFSGATQGLIEITGLDKATKLKTIPAGIFSLRRGEDDLTPTTALVLAEGLEYIGDGAFTNTLFSSVVLPSTLKGLGFQSFANMPVTGLILPDGLEVLHLGAMSMLTSIDIPLSVKAWRGVGGAFESTLALDEVDLSHLITMTELASAPFVNSGVKTVLLPPKVADLPSRAFAGATQLTRLELPEALVSIDESAFINVIALKHLTLPANVVTATNIFGFVANPRNRCTLETVTILSPTADITGSFECASLKIVYVGPGVDAVKQGFDDRGRNVQILAAPPTEALVVDTAATLAQLPQGQATTFTVALATVPSADVEVRLVSNHPYCQVAPADFAFSQADGTAAKVATVTALRRGVSCTITADVTGGAGEYAGVAAAEVNVATVDNGATCTDKTFADGGKWYDLDGPVYDCEWYAANNRCLTQGNGFRNEHTAREACCACQTVVDKTYVPAVEVGTAGTAARVAEGGSTPFTVYLASPPGADVTLSVTSDNPDCAPMADVVFTKTAPWHVPQTVTVAAVNDAVDDGDQTCNVAVAVKQTTDAGYSGLAAQPVTVETLDDDSTGIVLDSAATASHVNEGLTTTFALALASDPTAAVVLSVESQQADCTVSTGTVAFNPSADGNLVWNVAQTVTVTSVADKVDDDDQTCVIKVHVGSTTDATYTTYKAVAGPSEVSVVAVDVDMAAIVLDNTLTALSVAEGETTTFTLALATDPTADVVLNVMANNQECVTSVGSVTFAPTGAHVAPVSQTVTVRSVADKVDDGDQTCTITASVAPVGGDAKYREPVDEKSVSLTAVDVDTAAIVMDTSATNTLVAEGATTTFTLALGSKPSAASVKLVTAVDNSYCSVDAPEVTIAAADWATPVTVTVTAVNDDQDVQRTCIVTTSQSGDVAEYKDVAAVPQTLTPTNDDTAALVLAGAQDGTAVAEGTSITFQLKLGTAPTSGTVTVDLASSSSDCRVTPQRVTFDAAHLWSVDYDVEVRALQDNVVDGHQTCPIFAHVEEGAPEYAGVETSFDVRAQDVAPAECTDAAVTDAKGVVREWHDSDGPQYDCAWYAMGTRCAEHGNGFEFYGKTAHQACCACRDVTDKMYTAAFELDTQHTQLTLTEGQDTMFALHLATEPTSAVVFDIAVEGDGCTTDVVSVTFDSKNPWYFPQGVWVTAVQNDDLNGQRQCTVQVSVNGATGDGDYAALVAQNFVLTVNDDETPVPPTPGTLMQTEKWCNTDKVMLEAASHGIYSNPEACIAKCQSFAECKWIGFRRHDGFCELWGAGSCASPHDQPGHDIYLVGEKPVVVPGGISGTIPGGRSGAIPGGR